MAFSKKNADELRLLVRDYNLHRALPDYTKMAKGQLVDALNFIQKDGYSKHAVPTFQARPKDFFDPTYHRNALLKERGVGWQAAQLKMNAPRFMSAAAKDKLFRAEMAMKPEIPKTMLEELGFTPQKKSSKPLIEEILPEEEAQVGWLLPEDPRRMLLPEAPPFRLGHLNDPKDNPFGSPTVAVRSADTFTPHRKAVEASILRDEQLQGEDETGFTVVGRSGRAKPAKAQKPLTPITAPAKRTAEGEKRYAALSPKKQAAADRKVVADRMRRAAAKGYLG
jgi:hypothetical protein